MPVAGARASLVLRIVPPKTNLRQARHHLKDVGVFDCRYGTGIHTPALYSVTMEPFRQLPHQVTRQLTHELTVQLPHSNIKDKDEDIINSQHAREDGHKSLDELESLLLADTVWQDKIIEVLAKRENWIIDRYRLHGNIRDFFDEQRIGGNAQRDESDCRSHFYHWIIKHLNTTRYGTKRKSPTYRDSDVTAESAEDYEGAF